jgi:hypothetical protein
MAALEQGSAVGVASPAAVDFPPPHAVRKRSRMTVFCKRRCIMLLFLLLNE